MPAIHFTGPTASDWNTFSPNWGCSKNLSVKAKLFLFTAFSPNLQKTQVLHKLFKRSPIRKQHHVKQVGDLWHPPHTQTFLQPVPITKLLLLQTALWLSSSSCFRSFFLFPLGETGHSPLQMSLVASVWIKFISHENAFSWAVTQEKKYKLLCGKGEWRGGKKGMLERNKSYLKHCSHPVPLRAHHSCWCSPRFEDLLT